MTKFATIVQIEDIIESKRSAIKHLSSLPNGQLLSFQNSSKSRIHHIRTTTYNKKLTHWHVFSIIFFQQNIDSVFFKPTNQSVREHATKTLRFYFKPSTQANQITEYVFFNQITERNKQQTNNSNHHHHYPCINQFPNKFSPFKIRC